MERADGSALAVALEGDTTALVSVGGPDDATAYDPRRTAEGELGPRTEITTVRPPPDGPWTSRSAPTATARSPTSGTAPVSGTRTVTGVSFHVTGTGRIRDAVDTTWRRPVGTTVAVSASATTAATTLGRMAGTFRVSPVVRYSICCPGDR